jgi:rhodanese-related sulfurtransferase
VRGRKRQRAYFAAERGEAVAQYNLGVPIPNALLPEVARMIRNETGTPEFHDVAAKAAEGLVARHRAKPGFLVLDVRTPAEFSGGRIAGALNVDFRGDDFGRRLAALDRRSTYLVHCAAGGRSAKAVERMRELGFRRVYHMTDGFNAWEKAGLPVER